MSNTGEKKAGIKGGVKERWNQSFPCSKSFLLGAIVSPGGSGKFERLGAVKVSGCESGLTTNLTIATASLQAAHRGCGA